MYSIEDKGLEKQIIYRYIRGSHAYGLAIEGVSDIDTGAVYCAPLDKLIGTRTDYQDQVADAKNDNVVYELEKYIRLLGVANPTMLESLFVSDEQALYEHPAMKLIRQNRDKFITKKCFKAFGGYAVSQIRKARGLNKKIVQPMVERKDIMDFCFTPYKQGSTNIKNWLAYRGLEQEYCGCVNIPNMINTIGVYYDWKHFFQDHDFKKFSNRCLERAKSGIYTQSEIVAVLKGCNRGTMPSRDSEETQIQELYYDYDTARYRELMNLVTKEASSKGYASASEWHEALMRRSEDYMYRGIINPSGTNNEIRLSSVSKDEIPLCTMTFNINGYSEHCRQYREFKEWEKNRNPTRYKCNLHHSYDSKNLMHSFRLVKMCIEIAQGKGFILDRRGIDREFLLDIRNHKYEYEELIEKLDSLKDQMDEAIEKSTLPEDIDVEFLDNLTIEVRKEFWKTQNLNNKELIDM
jgi:hypothetical protein